MNYKLLLRRTQEGLGSLVLMGLVLMGLVSAFTAVGVAAPFQNGTFDQPVVSGGALVLDCPGVVVGWTHSNNCNNGAELLTKSGSFGLSTLDGGQYITFGGNGFTGGTLEQTFDTVVGGLYSVDYLLAIQQGSTSQSMKIEAFDGATLLGSNSSTDFVFSTLTAGPTLHFTATSGSTTLRFTDLTSLTNSVSANWALDTVTEQFTPGAAPTSGVPEPGTWLLATAGLSALLARANRSPQPLD